jgi:ankyrin repeat protein
VKVSIGITALPDAISGNHVNVARFSDNKLWLYGLTPLSYTVSRGQRALVSQLMATDKANPNSQDIEGWTPRVMLQ